MNINLTEFQIKAIKNLFSAMKDDKKEIILKSPTGSGKTIILTHFMHEYMKGNSKIVFVWLTPGNGNLEEQSKAKMDMYIHGARTKLLSDVMTSGFEEGDACFINWEKLTKKGNNALKDSEHTNFIEWIQKAKGWGLKFKIIIDESHRNDTVKADEILQYFKTDKIIRSSATPINYDANKSTLIDIPEKEVIAQGLIKKLIVINEDLPQEVAVESEIEYLLEKAYKKQLELNAEFKKRNVIVNPLILVQLPNEKGDSEKKDSSENDGRIEQVINYFAKQNITIENGLLSVWLSQRHENLDGIEKNDAVQQVLIMKQAVATGWDCPRAHILVKLRKNSGESFEIQTIGRIRRMPEAKHYENQLLDSCYIYTWDEKFTSEMKMELGDNAYDAKVIYLKDEYKEVKLVKEQRSVLAMGRDMRKTTKVISDYFLKNFCGGDKKHAIKFLETNHFTFSPDIEKWTVSGKVVTIDEIKSENLNAIKFSEKLNTHVHGKEFHNRVGRIGQEIGIDYANAIIIINKLFSEKNNSTEKILKLEPRKLYAFVINNFDLIRRAFRDSMSAEINSELDFGKMEKVVKKDFFIPQSVVFTYDAKNKVQKIYSKNVYSMYLSSAEKRSRPEKLFEKFLEENENVDWFYKNGDSGEEFFSVVYVDNGTKQKLFYPDYVVSVKGELWICETKGGWNRTGNSQDIDAFSKKKFEVLKKYIDEMNLRGGFVRYDENSSDLFIATDDYSDDIQNECWKLLSDIWG